MGLFFLMYELVKPFIILTFKKKQTKTKPQKQFLVQLVTE